jgi:selenocysteine lyase/cysteine desulfurase
MAPQPCSQDAVYFSPHKLVGGPGAPGVLVVKRRLLNIAKVPTQPGGGTVFFVTNKYAAAAHIFVAVDMSMCIQRCLHASWNFSE